MSKCHIIMYHYVRDLKNTRYPGIKGLDYLLFKEQMEYLMRHFTIVRIEDVIAAYDAGEELPKNAALLTFDDGFIDHFTYVFPLLNHYGVQGTFYIPGITFRENMLLDTHKIHFILASGGGQAILRDLLDEINAYSAQGEVEIPSQEALLPEYEVPSRFDTKETIFIKRMLQTVLPEAMRHQISSKLFEKYVGISETQFARELYMNEDQIRCLAENGMHIGLHGYNHYWLSRLDSTEMQADIDQSIEAMRGIVDSDGWVFNYPYGDYNEDVVSYLKEKGCKLSMTTEVRTANVPQDDRYRLPRWDTNDFPPKSENYLEKGRS